eukprot:390450_1
MARNSVEVQPFSISVLDRINQFESSNAPPISDAPAVQNVPKNQGANGRIAAKMVTFEENESSDSSSPTSFSMSVLDRINIFESSNAPPIPDTPAVQNLPKNQGSGGGIAAKMVTLEETESSDSPPVPIKEKPLLPIDGARRRSSSSQRNLLKTSNCSKTPLNPLNERLLAIINNPNECKRFREFLTCSYCDENLMFYEEVVRFRTLLPKASLGGSTVAGWAMADIIFEVFVKSDSPKEINISHTQREEIEKALEGTRTELIQPDVFDDAQRAVFDLMCKDSLIRYDTSRSKIRLQSQTLQ